MKLAITTICLLLGVSSSVKLPASFTKCDRKKEDFSKCLAEAVHHAMRQLTHGIPEVGLPNLHPLEVPSLTIAAGTSAVGLQQNFRNVKIYGITNLECQRMDVYFGNKTMENLCTYPQLRMESDYDISGKVLLLKVYGKGDSVVTLDDVKISVSYKYDEYQKHGKTHFKITDIDLKLVPGKVHYYFGNLFDGNKQLSDNIHQVVNENWKEIYDDVSSSYDDAFGQITRGIFNAVLSKVPASDMFGEE